MDFINPSEIINQIKPKKAAIAADFGCGSGGWVIPLAKRLENGRVFAIDIQEEALSALEGKIKLHNLVNIKKILADVEKNIPEIKNSTCDLVLFTDLLFQLDNKEAVFKEASRILKPKGVLLVVDWDAGAVFGPKQGKVSPEQVKELANQNGFQPEDQFKAGGYHYALLFTKKDLSV